MREFPLGRSVLSSLAALAAIACLAISIVPASAQINAPVYGECYLTSIFPAGGQQGQTIVVELSGSNYGYFPGAKEVIIDDPPGITVKDLKLKANDRALDATFVIAPDAALGRRCVRVLNERSGLTNMLYFTVGRLPETLEVEPNNELSAPQTVALPVVVNGRVDPQADVDGYAFDLKAGQRLLAVVLAHAIDSHGQYKNYGFVDATLQVVDAQGRVVAEAGDTLGLDPQVEFVAPQGGRYTARVYLEAFDGFPQAVYRLVLGDVALATSAFPPGGQRGTTIDIQLAGPGIPPGTTQKVAISADELLPLQYVTAELAGAADLELPLVRGTWPEVIEAEPNPAAAQATTLALPTTANGRIDQIGDEDWYRLPLAPGQNVLLETTAHRMLRSPIDTLIQVFDAAGKKLAENDDGFAIDYISMHDFRSTDSRLVFAAPVAGDYFVRVSDQAGSGGPRAVYRLGVSMAEPDFALWLHPDNVPIWGPGSTAAMVVKVNRWDGLGGDIKLKIEGLPPGWVGSENIASGPQSPLPNPYPPLHHFLTITAPADAKPGDFVPLKIVGRAEVNGRAIERPIQPLTLYYTSDTGLFRMTPVARAAVAKAQTPWLSTDVKEITVELKGKFEIPLVIHNASDLKTIDLTAQLATSGVACALSPPQAVAIQDGKAVLPVTLPESITYPGPYGITVALRWGSDIRGGMPGPCTPLIRLNVTAKP
ncbi:MAG: PPC domain-containing protein [Planctomycetaceae bacterium]|nr:PPC domain-containing protein [Planctomycetaceae bacterium]